MAENATPTDQAFPPPPDDYDPYRTLPPRPVPNERLDPSVFVQFVELWEKEENFAGDLSGLLDDKVRTFLHLCYRLDIRPGQFHAVFWRILTGRARLYYFDHVDRNDTLATAYVKMKSRFDSVWDRNYHLKVCTHTTFDRVRQENPDKDLKEVLQILLDKLELSARAINANETYLRDTVIFACRGVPEFAYAYTPPLQPKPTDSYGKIVCSLRMSIDHSITHAFSHNEFVDHLELSDRRSRRSRRRTPE